MGHKTCGKNIVLDQFYLTSRYYKYYEYKRHETCTALDIVNPMSKTGSAKGFAKGPTIYVATDDLVVIPLSSISVVSLLNGMNISISDLEENVASIGIKEGQRILKASLTSTSALSNGTLGHLLAEVKEEK